MDTGRRRLDEDEALDLASREVHAYRREQTRAASIASGAPGPSFIPNVLISAQLSPNGTPAQLLAAWMDGQSELVLSLALLAELAGVLDRPKLRRWLTAEEAHAFMGRLRSGTTLIEDPSKSRQARRTPATITSSPSLKKINADCLVSGDATSRDWLTLAGRSSPPSAFDSLQEAKIDGLQRANRVHSGGELAPIGHQQRKLAP